MFDSKHSDQTVLNKLRELITEAAEEERNREEGKRGKGSRGEEKKENLDRKSSTTTFLNLIIFSCNVCDILSYLLSGSR